MLAPSIQYARAADTVSIAFTSFGHGGIPVLALRPPESSHLGFEFTLPMETRHHEFERLSAARRVIRFDPRGAGLSDRTVAGLSLEARLSDIDAVATRLGIERFAIQATLLTCAWAVAYAVTRPGRVTHLVLHEPYLAGRDLWDQPRRRALESLIPHDWHTYTEASMSHAFDWAPGDVPRALAAQMRAAISPAVFLATLEADRSIDVSAMLAHLTCPVLAVHIGQSSLAPRELALRVAATAPDGRLALPATFNAYIDQLNAFLDSPGPTPGPAGLQVVLVADAEAGPGRIHATITSHGGAPRSLEGSSLGIFRSAQDALRCARELAGAAGASVGIHGSEPAAGTPFELDPSVTAASHASTAARPGQVVVTSVVRELVAGKGFGFAELAAGRAPAAGGAFRLFALDGVPGR